MDPVLAFPPLPAPSLKSSSQDLFFFSGLLISSFLFLIPIFRQQLGGSRPEKVYPTGIRHEEIGSEE
jgi:hypothetical protein